jgi:anti-sigma regulatory factor (Ser/Thr protein kinase)
MDDLILERWGACVKRPTQRWRFWHLLRAQNEEKRATRSKHKGQKKRERIDHRVTLWDGIKFRQAVCTNGRRLPPKVLCLEENRSATLGFLGEIRENLAVPVRNGKPIYRTWYNETGGPKGAARIKEYWDFSSIERIGTSAAVILASEYDRARRVMGAPPVTVNIESWSNPVFKTLFELGFFDIVGLVEGQSSRYAQTQHGETLITSMISDENGNGLPSVSEAIRDLTSFINSSCAVPPVVLTNLNTAIGEAMINVSRHAYEPPFESRFAYEPRWWFTAEANRETRKITAVLFDQGATIPVTLPYKERSWPERLGLMGATSATSTPSGRGVDEMLSDVDAIKYAMREGTTQTEIAGRGRGLPQMRKLIDKYRPGKLTVMSRAGIYSYATDGGVHTNILETPIGGTLLEWEIEVPR